MGRHSWAYCLRPDLWGQTALLFCDAAIHDGLNGMRMPVGQVHGCVYWVSCP